MVLLDLRGTGVIFIFCLFTNRFSRVQYKLTELSKITTSKLFRPKEGLVIFFHGFVDTPDKISSKTVVENLVKKGLF